MKTVLLSSAFALMIIPAAMADQMGVVDFNQDGIVGPNDFIGNKAAIAAAVSPTAYTAQPQVVTQEVTRVVTIPGSTNAVPVATLAPEGGNYVNVGAYQGGTFGTLETTPSTTRTITETRQVVVAPARADTLADVYPNPHGSTELRVSKALMDREIYTPPIGADGVITAAEMGWVDQEYADDRLAAFDTNKDGVVTTSEAIANLDPQLDPNEVAVDGGINSLQRNVSAYGTGGEYNND